MYNFKTGCTTLICGPLYKSDVFELETKCLTLMLDPLIRVQSFSRYKIRAYIYLESLVGKIVELESFHFESLKLERFG